MANKTPKNSIDTEQRKYLGRLHSLQIISEICLASLALTIYTLNISSVWIGYGVIDFLIFVAVCLTLFVCGIWITVLINRLKNTGNPLETSIDKTNINRWMIVAWFWIPVSLIMILWLASGGTKVSPAAWNLTVGIIIVSFFAIVIRTLVAMQSLWRKFASTKITHIRPALYFTLGAIMLLVAIFGSYTTTDSINFASTTSSDANLELGQTEIRQVGKLGVKQTTHNLIFAAPISSRQTDPVDQITAKGTRRYQYMYCTNGGYRYFTADQFKNPDTGFTHQSPDYCAQNNAGTETTLADVPPAPTQTTYIPTYTPRPTTTHCYSLYSSSIDCYSY